MTRHPCDRIVELGGASYRMRFTLRSLALMSLYLEAKGPLDLVALLKLSDAEQKKAIGERLLRCFLMDDVVPVCTDAELAMIMPILAEMIEEAFRDV